VAPNEKPSSRTQGDWSFLTPEQREAHARVGAVLAADAASQRQRERRAAERGIVFVLAALVVSFACGALVGATWESVTNHTGLVWLSIVLIIAPVRVARWLAPGRSEWFPEWILLSIAALLVFFLGVAAGS
jgi:hypothetical protein